MTDTDSAKNGADILLEQLEAQRVDCIFASPISVMAPIWEAFSRHGKNMKLRYFRCRHELLAVSLASGYYKATGRSQVVFLPTSLGVQNGSMGLNTALQERTPMTVLSPDTLSYGDDPDGDPGAEWPALLTDHAGPARNAEAVTKWSKRARTPSDLAYETRRAKFLAESVPMGPTLLEVPFQLLMGNGHPDIPAWFSPTPVVATPQHIDRVAQILSGATYPIIITEHGGRTDDDRAALLRIAEALAAPVFEFWMPAYHNFPRTHPLYRAGSPDKVLGEVDAVLLAGCNGLWHPPHAALRPGCAVIHLDQDPLRPRAAYWGYPTTEAVAGDLSLNLAALAANLRTRAASRPGGSRPWAGCTQGIHSNQTDEPHETASETTDSVTVTELFDALQEALPENAICVDEITSQVPQMIQFLYARKPFQQYRGWAGALGTGLGSALGVKLACPDRLVVCIIGDGAWHYNPVPAALGFAQEYGVPLLIVLCNNRQYASQNWNFRKYFPDSAAVREENFVGDVIQPTPDYVKQAEAYGGTGECVQNSDALRPALQRALEAVISGRTFLLDAIVNP
ncbi:hypothetical protein BTO20_16975 [Mycobacterium dioxanotrophicus]|uniref:acetolactate synthase n=1 Tax=Mycobacterium dioxanotrophicus TaxID=482462 RepID=A0A1Y0C4C1_9MYCO|nr:thiamine pyrophosphate-dependent enzyme [Mycobacterium dioxanotrophicus]ART70043.1 hypothetical protein BTO20_16975 [Mycobacterium dioxanotrophicus]